MSHGSIQAPLMAIIILFEIFILDELSIPLVDTVVGQVREFVAFAVGGCPCLLSLLVLVAVCFCFYIWCLFRLAVVFLLVYYGVALAWAFAFSPCGGKF